MGDARGSGRVSRLQASLGRSTWGRRRCTPSTLRTRRRMAPSSRWGGISLESSCWSGNSCRLRTTGRTAAPAPLPPFLGQTQLPWTHIPESPFGMTKQEWGRSFSRLKLLWPEEERTWGNRGTEDHRRLQGWGGGKATRGVPSLPRARPGGASPRRPQHSPPHTGPSSSTLPSTTPTAAGTPSPSTGPSARSSAMERVAWAGSRTGRPRPMARRMCW